MFSEFLGQVEQGIEAMLIKFVSFPRSELKETVSHIPIVGLFS